MVLGQKHGTNYLPYTLSRLRMTFRLRMLVSHTVPSKDRISDAVAVGLRNGILNKLPMLKNSFL